MTTCGPSSQRLGAEPSMSPISTKGRAGAVETTATSVDDLGQSGRGDAFVGTNVLAGRVPQPAMKTSKAHIDRMMSPWYLALFVPIGMRGVRPTGGVLHSFATFSESDSALDGASL